MRRDNDRVANLPVTMTRIVAGSLIGCRYGLESTRLDT
jgi:hypothetical protein